MSRMSRAAKAALALAGAACFTTSIAEASNMGFKLERSFNLERRGDGSPLPNVYWVSFPLFNGLGDVSNYNAGTNTTCCVGDTGCPAGDGVITAGDFICDAWTARRNPGQEGFFQVSTMNRTTCTLQGFTGAILGGVRFTGTNFPLDSEVGYQVNIGSSSRTITPQNPAVIVGSHDPGWTGRVIQPSLSCAPTATQAEFLNLPYHTMYREANEILCGLKGTDWDPVGAAGDPNRCIDPVNGPTGLFDGAHALQVQYFDNAQGRPVGRTVALLGPNLFFSGTNFDLVPGESYKAIMTRLHLPTTWITAHF